MRSALRTFTSALGVCAACYLLSTASWHQVLLLFLVASFGWCWFVFSNGLDADSKLRAPRVTPSKQQLADNAASRAVPKAAAGGRSKRQSAAKAQPGQLVQSVQSVPSVPSVQPMQRIQKVYRFPMHELSRATLKPIAEFD